MTEVKEARTSVLAKLTSEVMADKKTAARRTLTPVEGETAPRATLPNDVGLFMSNERLHDHAKELRKFAEEAIAIADGLDAMLNETSVPVVKADPLAEKQAAERAADSKFREEFERKQAEAQAAVFGRSPGDTSDEPDKGYGGGADPADADDGVWRCPDHGKAGVDRVSPKGRTYTGCPIETCTQFTR